MKQGCVARAVVSEAEIYYCDTVDLKRVLDLN